MRYENLDDWVVAMLARTPVRANSLIITVFGDAIAPHGGSVWLGSLIDLLAPLGINSRAVRTSVFRLTQEGWLEATPIGRRSAYSLTDTGRRRIHHAYRRIYDTPQEAWTGEWQLVLVPEGTLTARQREELRHDLLWEGYGALAPGVFALPAGESNGLREILRQNDCVDSVVLLRATTLPQTAATSMHTLVDSCWHLDRLAADYRRFTETFAPAAHLLSSGSPVSNASTFILRTLLIHEFRRILLRDPQLPDSLLAQNWPGHMARTLCRDIYERTLERSEKYLLATVTTPGGSLPAADSSLYARFGGLTRTCQERQGATERA